MKIYSDSLHKIAYATDASVYREIPYGVAYPAKVADIQELMRTAREKSIDLIPRAGGTSIAGQVVGSGIVADISKHWNKILEINAEERWARVQPGVVRDELNIALKPYGLFFSPETSTSNRCCIGGMFGNNSCGTHSLVYGSTRHHVIAAKGVLTDGTVEDFKEVNLRELSFRFGKKFWEKESHESLIESIYAQLIRFAFDDKIAELIAENYPDKELQRRSCGYAIDEVIEGLKDFSKPILDRTINLCKLLAGSEGTLAFITEITVSLDELPPKEIMVVCGHCDSLEKSFETNLIALEHQPTAVELMDGDILKLSKGNPEQEKNRFFVEGDPAALLITELRADTRWELDNLAKVLENDLLYSGLVYKCTRVYGADVAKVWALRKAGLGILGGMKGDAKPMGVIEDTAVAPKRLPAYMKDFREMLDRLGAKCGQSVLTVVFYGHISTGELHLRPIINLKTKEGRELFRNIATETARLVKKHRGSISGEHGDGRLRGEFIPLLYG
ncbi:MAG: FAD-binding oxidoreductase, partial [Prevotella sp.]|nr:FAD-binding oxidoreductase [Prevotella sp.]